MKKLDTALYLITDSTGFSESEFLKRVESAITGGVTLLQLREKEKTTCKYIELAKKVRLLTERHNIPLIIDDRLDVALASGADGVHLGRDDMPIDVARKIAGENFIIGATAKTVEAAKQAFEDGADYLGVGAIFPTTTKVKTVITPIATLRDICRAVPIPANAIGGLNSDNIDILKNTGISGICVVSAIMKSENPEASARMLLKKAREVIGCDK